MSLAGLAHLAQLRRLLARPSTFGSIADLRFQSRYPQLLHSVSGQLAYLTEACIQVRGFPVMHKAPVVMLAPENVWVTTTTHGECLCYPPLCWLECYVTLFMASSAKGRCVADFIHASIISNHVPRECGKLASHRRH